MELLFFLHDSQCLQADATSTSSQLAELMMVARVNLTSELPCDLPPDALLSHGTFLINLEGELGDGGDGGRPGWFDRLLSHQVV